MCYYYSTEFPFIFLFRKLCTLIGRPKFLKGEAFMAQLKKYDCEKCGEEVFYEDAEVHLVACEGFSAEDAGILAALICEDDDDSEEDDSII